MDKMLNIKRNKDRKQSTDNNFIRLISDSLFISKNKREMDFNNNYVFFKPVLTGRIYIADSSPSFNEVQEDIDDYLIRNQDVLDMVYLHTDKSELEVYKTEYKTHTITAEYIEVEYKTSKKKRLYF